MPLRAPIVTNAIVGLFMVAWPTSAQAAPTGDERWHLDAQAQTNFPLDLGARLSVEMPYRFLLSTSLGGIPGGYVDVINAVVIRAGGYDQPTADFVKDTLKSALLWRLHAGWRPFRKYGFYFEVGYGLTALKGGAKGGEVIALATGNEDYVDRRESFSVDANLHMLNVELGWQWQLLRDHLILRVALGYAGTMGSRTSVSTNAEVGEFQDDVDAFVSASEDDLDGLFRKHVHAPVVTFGIGYRFF